MSKYSISINAGTRPCERYPIEGSGPAALRRELVHFIGDVLKEASPAFWNDEDWTFEVRDERGLILYTVSLQAYTMAATGAN